MLVSGVVTSRDFVLNILGPFMSLKNGLNHVTVNSFYNLAHKIDFNNI